MSPLGKFFLKACKNPNKTLLQSAENIKNLRNQAKNSELLCPSLGYSEKKLFLCNAFPLNRCRDAEFPVMLGRDGQTIFNPQ